MVIVGGGGGNFCSEPELIGGAVALGGHGILTAEMQAEDRQTLLIAFGMQVGNRLSHLNKQTVVGVLLLLRPAHLDTLCAVAANLDSLMAHCAQTAHPDSRQHLGSWDVPRPNRIVPLNRSRSLSLDRRHCSHQFLPLGVGLMRCIHYCDRQHSRFQRFVACNR